MKCFSVLVFLYLCAITVAAVAMEYSEITALKQRIQQSIASGKVAPERDLAPLIAAARSEQDKDNKRRLIEAIGDFGSAGGDSPAAVKQYLLQQSTPFLLEVAGKRGTDVFLRWEAMSALRGMGAPKAVLLQIADMCEQDPDDFIKSRGEILRNYAQSLPDTSEVASIKPTDTAREQKGIALLKSRSLGVSLDQLRISSLEGKADEVQALLDAGVDPNAGAVSDSPLERAISGCSHQKAPPEAYVQTVGTLIAGGANVKAKDENDNTYLLRAAQYCGVDMVNKLIASGAEVNVTNKSGINALGMALIMNRIEVAETLVAKGARLTPQQAQMVSGNTDPRVKAIVQKATRK